MAKTTKKPTAKQLAARKKFAAMAKARAKAAKAKKPKAKKTETKKATSTYQTGSSNKLYDSRKKAQGPGKRVSKGGANQYGVSKGGSVYYERRKNRSDMPGSLTGIKGLKKISGVAPHKAKYFIEFMHQGIERTEYFDKLPKGVYKGENKILYVMKLTDKGTSLLPLLYTKNNLPVKK